jgi:hypothetical protein
MTRHFALQNRDILSFARMDQTISREEMHLKTVWRRQRQGFADELRFDDLLRRPDEPDDNEHQAATLAPSEDWQRLNSVSVALSGWLPQQAILQCTLIRRAGCALRYLRRTAARPQ